MTYFGHLSLLLGEAGGSPTSCTSCVLTQRANDVKMTSYQRRCDVMTSMRRSDIILTSCACWEEPSAISQTASGIFCNVHRNGVSTTSDTNLPVQSLKQVKSLKFEI